MIETANDIGRRSFIRTLSAAALGTCVAGARIFGFANVADATVSYGCCSLAYAPNDWCGWYCSHYGAPWHMTYWVCGNNCKCWECNTGSGCMDGSFACSAYYC